MITHPGIYAGIDETVYHADSDLAPELGRSLSQSGAKTLLASPARFAWERDHGRPPKDAYDLGTLVHALVLRSRDDRIRVVDARDWKTKRAQEARDEARAGGMVPVLRSQLLDLSLIHIFVDLDQQRAADAPPVLDDAVLAVDAPLALPECERCAAGGGHAAHHSAKVSPKTSALTLRLTV